MAEARRHDFPDLPPDSALSLEEYLEMQRAVGQKTRYRILVALLEDGEAIASELADRLAEPADRLHYHLDELRDVGLVENRKRR